jgi:hypothetical protein
VLHFADTVAISAGTPATASTTPIALFSSSTVP